MRGALIAELDDWGLYPPFNSLHLKKPQRRPAPSPAPTPQGGLVPVLRELVLRPLAAAAAAAAVIAVPVGGPPLLEVNRPLAAPAGERLRYIAASIAIALGGRLRCIAASTAAGERRR